MTAHDVAALLDVITYATGAALCVRWLRKRVRVRVRVRRLGWGDRRGCLRGR